MERDAKLKKEKRKENMEFYKSIDYSGFFERLFARAIDLILVAGIVYLLYKPLGILRALIIGFSFDVVSRILMTYFWGATIGKLVFGVRVISRKSEKLSMWQVIIRELAKLISFLPLYIGYIMVIFTKRKRTIHDIIACTAVTSGGREEASYAREVYGERPEKWNLSIAGVVTLIFVIGVVVSANRGANYVLTNEGMFGFSRIASSKPYEYSFVLPKDTSYKKDIFQVGNLDGTGGYDIFVEDAKDGKPQIRKVKLAGRVLSQGSIIATFDKPILQYKILDLDGDKKDEIAVLFEDKVFKVYKFDKELKEVASLGPLEYGKINAIMKAKPAANVSHRFYIVGDGNKLILLNMKDGKIVTQKFELMEGHNIVSIGMGIFGDENYLVAASDDGDITFYLFDGERYKETKVVSSPIKGDMKIGIADVDFDGKNDIIIESGNSILAYNIKGNRLKPIWDGGDFYKFNNQKMNIYMDECLDFNGDKKIEAFMTSRQVSGNTGKSTAFIFTSNDYKMMANRLLRILSLR